MKATIQFLFRKFTFIKQNLKDHTKITEKLFEELKFGEHFLQFNSELSSHLLPKTYRLTYLKLQFNLLLHICMKLNLVLKERTQRAFKSRLLRRI